MENSQLIKQYIQSLDHSVVELEPLINTLNGESFEDRLNQASTPQEQIKIANGYAYILTSLSFAYLKSQGVDTNRHPIMADLQRVKSYMKRATDMKKPQEKPVDTAAAKRFIEAALNSGSGNSTVIKGTPEPAISAQSFKGTHTKFEDDNDKTMDAGKVSRELGDKLRSKLTEQKSKKPKKKDISQKKK